MKKFTPFHGSLRRFGLSNKLYSLLSLVDFV